MKVLVWILAYFLLALIQTMLKMNGVLLGAIPTMILYGGVAALAGAICRSMGGDKKESGFTYTQAAGNVPPDILRRCGEFGRDRKALAIYLDDCVKEGRLERKYIHAILNEHSDPIPFGQIREEVPVTVLQICRQNRGKRDRLQKELHSFEQKNMIRSYHFQALLEEFGGNDIIDLVPPSVLDQCRQMNGDREKMKKYLESCVTYGLVKAEDIPQILDKLAAPREVSQTIRQKPEEKTVRVSPEVSFMPKAVSEPSGEKCDFTLEQQRRWLKTLNAVIPTIRLGGTGACVDQALEPRITAKLGGMRPAVTRVAWSISKMLSITNLDHAVVWRDQRRIQETCLILKEYGALLDGPEKEPVQKTVRYLSIMLTTSHSGE